MQKKRKEIGKTRFAHMNVNDNLHDSKLKTDQIQYCFDLNQYEYLFVYQFKHFSRFSRFRCGSLKMLMNI